MQRTPSHRLTLILPVLLLLLAAPAFAADYVLNLTDASLVGGTAVYDATSGAINDGYWSIGEGVWLPLPPANLFGSGAAVTIDDIDQVTYTTRTGDTLANVDVAFQMYTVPSSDPALGGNDSWYQRLLKAEPLYFDDYSANFPDDTWNTFDTNDATSPVRFYDGRGHTFAGFYGGPTLADVQGAEYCDLWSSFPSSGGDSTSYNYGNMSILSFVLATSTGGNWAGFEGDLDQLYISLNNGDTATVNFDAVNPSDNSPEPATWVLLACTGVAAVIRRRRAA